MKHSIARVNGGSRYDSLNALPLPPPGDFCQRGQTAGVDTTLLMHCDGTYICHTILPETSISPGEFAHSSYDSVRMPRLMRLSFPTATRPSSPPPAPSFRSRLKSKSNVVSLRNSYCLELNTIYKNGVGFQTMKSRKSFEKKKFMYIFTQS